MNIHDALKNVREQIRLAALEYRRVPEEITLLAVSKTRTVEEIREAVAAGQYRFGENYLQEALEKIRILDDPALEWHFIGPLQSNKTRPVAEHFAWVHGVDRLKLAERLSDQRPADQPPLNVCLQVNVSAEASKSGCTLDELPELAHAVMRLPHLRLRGLMTIPAPADGLAEQRRPFRILREAGERLQAEGLPLDTLSMGMSDDLQAAIAEGSTLLRIGTAIFGVRE